MASPVYRRLEEFGGSNITTYLERVNVFFKLMAPQMTKTSSCFAECDRCEDIIVL
jgi:hypothetical protein